MNQVKKCPWCGNPVKDHTPEVVAEHYEKYQSEHKCYVNPYTPDLDREFWLLHAHGPC